ncbi:hypothetical protein C5S53_07885 [Methanophagales archaeon]|nr:hypothetical protein C5S53_07885 [Methanophagales archaeon]
MNSPFSVDDLIYKHVCALDSENVNKVESVFLSSDTEKSAGILILLSLNHEYFAFDKNGYRSVCFLAW